MPNSSGYSVFNVFIQRVIHKRYRLNRLSNPLLMICSIFFIQFLAISDEGTGWQPDGLLPEHLDGAAFVMDGGVGFVARNHNPFVVLDVTQAVLQFMDPAVQYLALGGGTAEVQSLFAVWPFASFRSCGSWLKRIRRPSFSFVLKTIPRAAGVAPFHLLPFLEAVVDKALPVEIGFEMGHGLSPHLPGRSFRAHRSASFVSASISFLCLGVAFDYFFVCLQTKGR